MERVLVVDIIITLGTIQDRLGDDNQTDFGYLNIRD